MFTQGEWMVNGYGGDMQPLVMTKDRNTYIAIVCAGGNDEPNLEEAEANAQLIAAAPDLLAACKEAMKFIEVARQFFPKSIKNNHKFMLENICATLGTAIHKAEIK